MDLCEFEASLIYKVSSRTGSKATEKPCLEKKNYLLFLQKTPVQFSAPTFTMFFNSNSRDSNALP